MSILWIQLLLERSLESTYYLCSWKKKPFECDFCNPTSSHKCHIKLHVSSAHEGKKPFKYELCNFKILQKMTWVTMLPLFMKEKAFTCEICEKSLLLNLTWGNMKLLFIKIKCLSNVNLDVLKNMIWIFISHLLMKKEALNFSVVLLSKRVIWNDMYLPRP